MLLEVPKNLYEIKVSKGVKDDDCQYDLVLLLSFKLVFKPKVQAWFEERDITCPEFIKGRNNIIDLPEALAAEFRLAWY